MVFHHTYYNRQKFNKLFIRMMYFLCFLKKNNLLVINYHNYLRMNFPGVLLYIICIIIHVPSLSVIYLTNDSIIQIVYFIMITSLIVMSVRLMAAKCHDSLV